MKKCLYLATLTAFLCLFSGAAHAQCTGSGTTWACPAGASPADVNTAIASASNGATITFADGTYSWGAGSIIHFSNAKGATLICPGTCNVTSSGTVLGLPQYANGTNTNPYRISGFTFNYTGTQFLIWFAYSGDCGIATAPCVMTSVRIDHNTVNATNPAGGMVFVAFADDASVLYTFGVMDHNTLNSPASVQLLLIIAGLNTAPMSNALGTGNNFFAENNAINITTMTNAGLSCADSWGSARMVWRYNTETNCLWAAHGVSHSGGPDSIEFYANNATVNGGSVSQGFQDGYRLVHHQGSGSFLAFNNVFTAYSGKSSSVIEMLHYRDYPNAIDGGLPADAAQADGTVNGPPDAPYVKDGNRSPIGTNRGYPAWRQPGRDVATGNWKPMYSWNNYWSDTLALVPLNAPDGGYGTPDYWAEHMQSDREYFNAVSASPQTSSSAPFNGSTGMGFGTLARRPTTCPTNPENAFGMGVAGVGYFATDSGPQGTLYTCSANTWTVYYTPYTYPHPLVGGAPPASIAFSPTSLNFGPVVVGAPPACPTNCLNIVVSNPSDTPLNIGLPYNTSDPTHFVIMSNGCAAGGGIVGAHGSCTDVVQYVPSGSIAQNATITFTTNAPSSPDAYSMTGTPVSSITPVQNGISIFGIGPSL